MAMVTDFLIGFLLLLSATINILALGAFLITPSLRSTSNRFVINLLIVNVIGCIILAPSLLFNSNVIRNLYSEETEAPLSQIPQQIISIQSPSVIANDDHIHSRTTGSSDEPNVLNKSGEMGQSENNPVAKVSGVERERGEEAETENEQNSTVYNIDDRVQSQFSSDGSPEIAKMPRIPDPETETPYHRMRPWVLDIIAAIGSLSLVLVVGDTYVGVTDPLRYHSRVSASRVCILIVIVWISALGFGATSAFRGNLGSIDAAMDPGTDTDIDGTNNHRTVYNTSFRCTYFLCIILIPFSLVCAMYWGIIREARKNGLRLRHNGSSPLLQSVLHMGPSREEKRETSALATGSNHDGICSRKESLVEPSINQKGGNKRANGHQKHPRRGSNATTGQHLQATTEGSLRRNRSAQYLSCPTCECCDQILITRSISNQSAYLNSARLREHLKLPNRDLLRSARSSPELHRNLLGDQNGTMASGGMGARRLVGGGDALEHIRLPRRPTKTLGYMTSIRHRLSNASSMFKYREESRAARISILVVIMFLVSYIPFGLLVLIEGHNSFLSTYQQTVLAIFFVVLANIISPLIFAYRNKRVRRGIKRLVSVPGRAAAGAKEQRRTGNGGNNSSIKELSERKKLCGGDDSNNSSHINTRTNRRDVDTRTKDENSKRSTSSPRMIRLTRHTTRAKHGVMGRSRQGSGGVSLLHDNVAFSSSSSPSPPPPSPFPPALCHLESVQRRKLVIFNGRNGHVSKVFHPDNHSEKCPAQSNMKGCNKEKLLAHKTGLQSNSTRGSPEIGCPHALRLTGSLSTSSLSSLANQKAEAQTKNGSSTIQSSGASISMKTEDESLLQRIRIRSLFKRTNKGAGTPPPSPPTVTRHRPTDAGNDCGIHEGRPIDV